VIVTTPKPLDEVLDYISPYKNIMIVGCDGCTQPPRGLREANTLSQLLELGGKLRNQDLSFKTTTTAKQCDPYVTYSALKPQVNGVDAILSLACGIGVQELAQLFPDIPVFPVQNTHFMGAEEREEGVLVERCIGCGDCFLALTGGICPVTRCAKGLLNCACGGAQKGRCELDPERDCAWELIYNRLKERGKLGVLSEFHPPRDYQLKGWKVAT
jgi:hypothetical protein